jgi:hypothetical protein
MLRDLIPGRLAVDALRCAHTELAGVMAQPAAPMLDEVVVLLDLEVLRQYLELRIGLDSLTRA